MQQNVEATPHLQAPLRDLFDVVRHDFGLLADVPGRLASRNFAGSPATGKIERFESLVGRLPRV